MTRTFPIPGLARHAIGLKHVEEAVAIRDRLLTAFDQAASLPPGPERRKLLTVTFVGGGSPVSRASVSCCRWRPRCSSPTRN